MSELAHVTSVRKPLSMNTQLFIKAIKMSQTLQCDLLKLLLFGFSLHSSYLCVYFGNPQQLERQKFSLSSLRGLWRGLGSSAWGKGLSSQVGLQ